MAIFLRVPLSFAITKITDFEGGILMETTEPKTHLRYKFEVGEEITYETISKRNHGPPRRGREVDLNPGE